MAVRIRLKRTGRRNRAFYRVCVFDSRTRRDGAPVEELGSYDPRGETLETKVRIDKRRAHYWLTVGALPSETVASLLKSLDVRKDGPVPPEEEPVTAAAPAAPAEETTAAAGPGDATATEPTAKRG